jgi:hypothetical protein
MITHHVSTCDSFVEKSASFIATAVSFTAYDLVVKARGRTDRCNCSDKNNFTIFKD